jgi:hypothetical protein
MKTIKDELKDAVDLDMDKRDLGCICGNALAEIERLELLVVTLGMMMMSAANVLKSINMITGVEQTHPTDKKVCH